MNDREQNQNLQFCIKQKGIFGVHDFCISLNAILLEPNFHSGLYKYLDNGSLYDPYSAVRSFKLTIF